MPSKPEISRDYSLFTTVFKTNSDIILLLLIIIIIMIISGFDYKVQLAADEPGTPLLGRLGCGVGTPVNVCSISSI